MRIILNEGDHVRINAPASRKFNGRTGVITHKGRKLWNVRFDDDPDTILALNPSCLEPYEEPEEGPQGEFISGCLK